MARMRRTEYLKRILSCLVVFWFICVQGLHATDTLTVGQTMRDWNFLESPNKLFRLRFFSLEVSNLRYLGIQYRNYSSWMDSEEDLAKLVWVANRKNPLTDSSGILNITVDGNLVLTDSNGIFITISAGQPAISSNTSATLLDSGNLVLRSREHILWQSFDYPSDTWLPGMKIGIFDLNTGQPQHRLLTSFVSQQVPTLGTFTFGVNPNNTKQLVIWQRGVLYWRSGMWNGYNFSYFLDELGSSYLEFNFSYFSNESQSYFTYTMNDNNLSSWIEMGSSGSIAIFELYSDGGSVFSPIDLCPTDKLTYRSAGCAVIEPSNCERGDAFKKTQGEMDSWSFLYSLDNFSLGITDCKEICMRDCSCKAYGSASSDGSGCKFSYGQKLDFYEEVFYIRISSVVATESYTFAPSYPPMYVEYFHPTNMEPNYTPRKRPLWLMIGAPVVSACILILVSLLGYLRWRNHNFTENSERSKSGSGQGIEPLMHELGNDLAAIGDFSNAQMLQWSRTKDRELPLFSLSSIEIATDHFSATNTIGKGGFGPVFKGELANGQDIAVKRLSRSSQQGLVEFKNEVILISKLQHRNLVRLLGCCIEGEERILIYEYLPNKSLDSFLFVATKRALLDWKLRFCIIKGIAQGILYLHKHSRLRIIHRDLKTSNILLDSEMNPKISDFGTARVFQENESRANTNRIVGTYGYMSPEYAMNGLFSIKSDVFSFGVMMLEILSGKRNILSFHYFDRSMNLLGYAWELWIEGRSLELMDSALADSWPRIEAMRCVQIGLLCVQESAEDRPTMSQVLSMLTNESVALPTPNQRPLAAIASANNATLPENPEHFSVNMLTVTEVEAR